MTLGHLQYARKRDQGAWNFSVLLLGFLTLIVDLLSVKLPDIAFRSIPCPSPYRVRNLQVICRCMAADDHVVT